MKPLRLQKNEERRLLSGHLWIYSNEINNQATPLKQFVRGELVQVESFQGQVIGVAYVNPNTLLCGRLLTCDVREIIDTAFFIRRIQEALNLRERFFEKPFYRLIYSEGDFLPGVIIDRFDDTLVVQINTAGMDHLKDYLIEALLVVVKPRHILFRNDSAYRVLEGLSQSVEAAYGEPPELIITKENDCSFYVPIWQGQKTGWFYDHRDSRKHLLPYIKAKKVLDVFSYLGGFGITLAAGGANHVTCIDASEKAVHLILENAKLNHVESHVDCLCEDAFKALQKLREENRKFDVIVLDPPAFIKRKKDLKSGTGAYQQINQLALELLHDNGILLSASCSMHLSRDELLETLRRAAVKTKKRIRVLEQLHQSADHPINPGIEETNYLKGFILSVNT